MKYFVAEGIANQQSIHFYKSSHIPDDSMNFIEQLPHISGLPSSTGKIDKNDDESIKKKESDIKIAWQYKKYLSSDKDTLSLTSSKKKSWCHSFDLNKTMSAAEIKHAEIHTITFNPSKDHIKDKFMKLYEKLATYILECNQKMSRDGSKKIIRIAIQSISSPIWGSSLEERESQTLLFLRSLKGLLRQALASCMITIPSHLFSEEFMLKVRYIADSVVEFSAFTDFESEKNPVFAEFDGLFIVKKLHRINTLISLMSSQPTYTFEYKRKKLSIEKFHLPPEISRSTTSTDEEKKAKASLLCQPGPSGSSDLDF